MLRRLIIMLDPMLLTSVVSQGKARPVCERLTVGYMRRMHNATSQLGLNWYTFAWRRATPPTAPLGGAPSSLPRLAAGQRSVCRGSGHASAPSSAIVRNIFVMGSLARLRGSSGSRTWW